jgi:hypothetical protein
VPPCLCLSEVALVVPLVCLLALPAYSIVFYFLFIYLLLFLLLLLFFYFIIIIFFGYCLLIFMLAFPFHLTRTPALAGGLVGSSLSTPGFTLG